MKKLLITIDGPAGAGKSSTSRSLAERLGYTYIDTGALYRAVALHAMEHNIKESDEAGLRKLCETMSLSFVYSKGQQRLLLNDNDITDRIRTPEVSMYASQLSAKPIVRQFLLSIQRRLGREKKVIFEGRDMGTVVFPEADIKFFLEASINARAARRFDELPAENRQTLNDLFQDMVKRDELDSQRAISPLKPATDAIIIDSTNLSLSEVVDKMLNIIRQRIYI